MDLRTIGRSFPLGLLVVSLLCGAGSAFAADVIEGRVLGGGLPIANSTVTLWAATADPPKQLAQAKTDESGGFEIRAGEAQSDVVLYLVATGGEPKAQGSGDNPAIALMTVVGSKPPHNVVINEMTTIASVITHSQFIDGTAIKGSAARSCELPPTMCPTSWTSRVAPTARPFWMPLTVRRHPRWPTLAHSPAFWQRASHG